MKSLSSTFALLLSLLNSQAQDPIFLFNPSFEDYPVYNHVPKGWDNCLVAMESPPDTHPVVNGQFGVDKEPQDGKTYLGLVTRENGTTEQVSQKLPQNLEPGKCYSFSIHLCRSRRLLSISKTSGQPLNFNQPTVLRIWGGKSACDMKEILAVSPAIESTDWVKYKFIFKAEAELDYLTLEAHFLPDSKIAYNGNLLLDNASPIVPVDCSTSAPSVNMDSIVIPVYVRPFDPNAEGQDAQTEYFKRNALNGISLNTSTQLSDPKYFPEYIFWNCRRFGFQPGKPVLLPLSRSYLMELAENVGRFPDQHLSLALIDRGEKLNKKRAKKLKNILFDAGLSKKQFYIKRLTSDADPSEWQCSENDLWLKVEELK